MSARILQAEIRRGIHAQNGSRKRSKSKDVVAATLTEGVNVFVQNTAAASLGVSFNYLQSWSLGVQYTIHFPVFDSGKFDGLSDRDFVSALISFEI